MRYRFNRKCKILVTMCFVLCCGIFIKNTLFKNKDNLININNLSQEFMDNYFEEVSQVSEEDKGNMLIVTSKNKLKDTYGATRVIEAPNHQYFLQYGSEKEKNNALEEFNNDSKIEGVNENIIYNTLEDELGGLPDTYNSWGINVMFLDNGINAVNNNIENVNSVTVAIIDTGCDMTLFNKYYPGKIEKFYNVLDESDTMISDENGHGTHIAGTIAEGTPDNVKIIPIKVSTDGKMYDIDIITAINYIVYDKKADVINMSFGGFNNNSALSQAIKSANDQNIICVAAAGNDNTNKMHYPSSLDTTISIASIDSTLNKSSFSNYGSTIDFTAPGTNIKSIMGNSASISRNHLNQDKDDDHETISGTSMATPHAVNAVAILKSYNKDLSITDVKNLLKKYSIDLGEKGWDEYYGNGLISFKDVQFCDGNACDEFGVYKNIINNISGIEVTKVNFTNYNYYSFTNLMSSEVTVTYTDGITKKLTMSDLPNVEILNYDPNSTQYQDITVKVGAASDNINIINPSNYESGWQYNILDSGKIELTGYKNNGLQIKKLYIPETIDSRNVVALSDDFEFMDFGTDILYYTDLYLPGSFVRIGNYSLSNTNIKYVHGTDINIEVGAHAFENSSIIELDVPISKIEDYAFKDCFDLISIDIYLDDYEAIDIGQYAFYNCKRLGSFKTINLDGYNSIGDVGDYAFYNCVSLSYINMEPIGSIGNYAFYNTFLLFDFNLYNINDFIGQYAFYGSGIKEVHFSKRLEVVNESAFENCFNLKEVLFNGKRIESRAFWNSGVEVIGLSMYLEYLSDDAFAYTPMKTNSGSWSDVSRYKIIYKLGVVDTTNNKLIVGFTDHLKITDEIDEIGDYAFTGNNNLKEITIPSYVDKIGTHTFEDCYNLSNVYMLGNVMDFYSDSFKRSYEGEIKNEDLNIYVYKDSSIKQNLIENNLNYRHFEPDKFEFIDILDTYPAGTFLGEGNTPKVKLTYYEKETREEIIPGDVLVTNGVITDGFMVNINYENNGAYINYGDTYIKANIKTPLGYEVCNDYVIPINVTKGIPKYNVPTNLKGRIGQKLSEINLPSRFEWMNDDQVIDKLGETYYKARYIPYDTNNYDVVENIDVLITVNSDKTIIYPEISIADKIYDGTTSILTKDIYISNLDEVSYDVVEANASSSDVGVRSATVKLRLSDDIFESYTFDNDKQEKEIIVDFNIVKANLNVVDNSEDVTIMYDGKEHSIVSDLNYDNGAIVKFANDDNEYILDELPKYSDIGVYLIKYKVFMNDNYTEYFGEKTLIIEDNAFNDNEYVIDQDNMYISNVSANTDVEQFIYKLDGFSGYDISVDSKEVNGKRILYTGAKVRISYESNLYEEYTVSVKGDINGDGLLKLKDILTVKNYILKYGDVRNEFDNTGYLFAAGDYTSDGKISLKDFLQMKIDYMTH